MKKKTDPLAIAEYNSGFGAYGYSLVKDITSEDVIGKHLKNMESAKFSDHRKNESKKKNTPLYDMGLFHFD